MSEPTSRREFLVTTACSGAALAAGCGGEEPTTGGPVGSPNVEPIGDPSKYPDSTRMPTTPNNTVMPTCTGTGGVLGPAAESIGLNQAVAVQGMTNLYVVRDSTGVIAVNIACTHAGCPLALKTDRNLWECNCHGSRFSLTGIVVGGPATRNLPRYAVCRAPDGLTRIDTSKTI